MKLYMEPANLGYFEALASRTRLKMIRLLAERDMNVKELAEALDVSSSIMTKHVRKLESAGIIAAAGVSKGGSRHKVCTLLDFSAEIRPPKPGSRGESVESFRDTSVPVWQYADIAGGPPCGLADESRLLLRLDEPACLLESGREQARMLWLGAGYVEYLFPNYPAEGTLTAIEITCELASSAPGIRGGEGVAISLNGARLCSLTTPDFGEISPLSRIGRSRYGILAVIRVDGSGLYVNGERRNGPTLTELAGDTDRWRLRFDAAEGLTLFSGGCGNYNRDITLRVYYTKH